jgi:hypothetical protein
MSHFYFSVLYIADSAAMKLESLHMSRAQTVLRHFHRMVVGGFLAFMAALLFVAPALAVTPQPISYQARLLTASGSAVANGSYNIQFSLYDSASGGNRVWTAAGTTVTPSPVSVTVTNGLLTVLLGDTDAGQNPFDLSFNTDSLYLGITVGSDSEMTPRKRLVSVPFAFNADAVQGQSPSSTVAATGGDLFTVHQTSADVASAERTALTVSTEGTSSLFDNLLRGISSSIEVFRINRLGNIFTSGALDVASTNTTSTFAYAVSSTRGEFSQGLTVGGVDVCLENGANCLPGGSSQSLAQVTAQGATTTDTLSLFGGFLAASSTVTSTFTVVGNTSLQNTTFNNATGSSATTTNLFTTNGQVTNATVTSLLFDAATGTSATTTNLYADNGSINLGLISTAIVSSLTFTNGTSTSWFGFATASGTTLHASSVMVNGVDVCLENGSNCPTASDPTLAQVTAQGAATADTLSLFGGFLAASSTVISTFTVVGNTSLQNVTLNNATGSSVTTTNLSASLATVSTGDVTNLTFTNATGVSATTTNLYADTGRLAEGLITDAIISTLTFTNGTSTSWFGFSTASGTNVRAASIQVNGQDVCLEDGTNCLPSGVTSSTWQYNNTDNVAYMTTSTMSLFVGGSTTATSAFTVVNGGTTSTVSIGAGLGNQAYLGIGLDTPTEALDVKGNIRNVLASGDSFRIASTTITNDSPRDVEVVGSFAYVVTAGTSDSLQVFDVSNPEEPVVLGSVSVGNDPEQITVSNDYAYVANFGDNSLSVVDVSNPSSPSVVGTLSLTGLTTDVFHAGKYLYVTDGGSMKIVDVVNPANPVVISELALGNIPNSVVVQGRYAYVGNEASELHIIDVADPYNPTLLSTVSGLDGAVHAISVQGRYVYVSGNFNGFETIDVADPASPVLVDDLSGLSGIYSMEAAGRYVYARGYFSLYVVDITSSTAPEILTSMSGLGDDGRLDVAGRYIYSVGTSDDTLRILDMTGLETNGLLAGSVETSLLQVRRDAYVAGRLSVGTGMTVGADGIFSAGGIMSTTGTFQNGLQVNGTNVCLEDGTNCQDYLLALNDTRFVNTGAVSTVFPYAEAKSGDYLYTVGSSKLHVIDISNDEAPVEITSTTISGAGLKDIVISGSYAYVVNANQWKVHVFDISDPKNPVEVGSVSVTSPERLAIQGKYVYVTSNALNSLVTVDVSDPMNPVTVGPPLALGTFPLGIAVQGRYAYIANYLSNNLTLVDISEPASPSVLDTLSVGQNPWGVVAEGRYVYLADSAGSLFVVDSLDSALSVVGTLNGLGGGSELAITGHYVWTSGGSVVDVSDPTTPTLMKTLASASDVVASGYHIYYSSIANANVSIYKMVGLEAAALLAQSAELGELSVSEASVRDRLSVGSGLSVGTGGIFSQGDLTMNGTLIVVPTSTTSLFNGNLQVGGTLDNQYIDTRSITTLGTTSISSSVHQGAVAISGQYAYMTNYTDGTLSVVDIRHPSSPVEVGSVNVGTNVMQVAVQGDYAYVTEQTTLNVVDISNPSTPVVVGTSGSLGSSSYHALVISGHYAYVGNGAVVDISQPTNPMVVASLNAGGQRMAVNGHFVYAVNTSGDYMEVIDVSNPLVPVVYFLSLDDPQAIAVYGRFAYVIGSNSLYIVDVSDPTSPSLYQTASIGASVINKDIVVSGDRIFVVDTGGVLRIVNATQEFIATYDTYNVSSGANFITVDGGHAYIVNNADSNLEVLEIGGVETTSLNAQNANLGSLMVSTDAVVANQFSIGGGMSVGSGGISSQGSLSVFTSSTLATSTLIYNNASNTAPVLEIRGGCNNADATGAQLFKAGNNTDVAKFTISCNGNVFADGTVSSPAVDFAEYIASDGTLEVGNVVALDPTSGSASVRKAERATRNDVLGVYSTKPSFVGGASDAALAGVSSSVPVGLLGQVPTRSSAEVDAIAAGDYLMPGDNGTAIKAQGPGMVIGQALESLASGTSTILVFVKPMWWAGDVLASSDTGTALGGSSASLISGLTVVSSTNATLANAQIDSPLLSFQGSAWNETTNQAERSGFNLYTNMQAAPSSTSDYAQLTVASTSGTSLLTISNLGNVSVTGDLTVGRRLFLGSSLNQTGSTSTYIFVDDSLSPSSTYIATNADGWSTASTYDYAERFVSNGQLEAGDLVAIDPSGKELVKATQHASDVVMGVVSTKPGFITGAATTGTYPIALAGRVPTKVSNVNGPIAAGDLLAPSEIPGTAMKATEQSTSIIGYALEAFADSTPGRISMFVLPSVRTAGGTQVTNVTQTVSSLSRQGLAKVYAGSTSVQVTFESLNAFPLVNVTPYGQTAGYWIEQVTDTGFTIVLAQAPSFDLTFAWSAVPSKSGDRMSFSDNTSQNYDPLSGQVATQVTSTTVSEPVMPVAATSTTDASATSTASLPEDTTSSTQP